MAPTKRSHGFVPAPRPISVKRTKLTPPRSDELGLGILNTASEDGLLQSGSARKVTLESEELAGGDPETGSDCSSDGNEICRTRSQAVTTPVATMRNQHERTASQCLDSETSRSTQTSNTDAHIVEDAHATPIEPMETSSARAKPKSALLDLPLEIFFSVADFLPVTDLGNLLKTCRRIKRDVEQRLYKSDRFLALRWACSKRTEMHLKDAKAVVEKFVKYTATMDSLENGLTPLMIVARCGHPVFETLLDVARNADVNKKTERIICEERKVRSATARVEGESWTTLTFAAKNGHHAILRCLLKRDGIDTSATSTLFTKRGSTAEKRGFASQVREDTCEIRGNALFWATIRHHEGCVLALLQSSRVLITASEISKLRDMIERAQKPDLYECVDWMFEEYQKTSVQSRLDRFQRLTLRDIEDFVRERNVDRGWERIVSMGRARGFHITRPGGRQVA